MKFHKKFVVIDAYQLRPDNIKTLEEWCGGSIKGTSLPVELQCIDIQTLEGEMRADMGDWIIRGIKGEFYPCKPDIFEATYDPVNEGTARYEAYGLMGGDEFVSGHSMKRNLTGPS